MNVFEKMLREKFGFTYSFEFLMVADLEAILGPADDAKAEQLIKTLLDPNNSLVPTIILGQGESNALIYCKSLGWQIIKNMLLKAAQIIKK